MDRPSSWIRALRAAAGLAVIGLLVSAARAGDWPQWRGPEGDSVSRESGLPVVWGEADGVVWRTELPEWGTSTPAIWGDALFVTTQQEDRLLLLKLDKLTGELLWSRQVGSGTPKREGEKREQKFHRLHNMASPSPVTDGTHVVAHFGSGDLAVFDFDGNELWHRNLEREYGKYTIWWGHANSPVLVDGLVISVCMQDSLAGVEAGAAESATAESKSDTSKEDALSPSYLVAHDVRTGRERWKSMRMTGADAEQCDAYTTPVLHATEEGTELIVMGGNQLDAYDPRTGVQRWFLPGLIGGRTITGPTIGDGMVYCTQGMRGPLLAVRLGGNGELPRRAIAWKHEQGNPDSCCPVVWQDLLFTVADDGIVRCFDAVSGKLRWKDRVPGDYKASPLAAEGRIYFLNTQGLCTVLSAHARQFEKLAENQIDDETLASPAVSDGHIFLRGRKGLYCIGKP